MQHRKPAQDRKQKQIRVRVTVAQKQAIEAAARLAGLDAAAWVRSTALREALRSTTFALREARRG